MLKNSSKAAGPDRQADVYVGEDVFGRGSFGGGKYNCKAVCHCNSMFVVWMVVLDFLYVTVRLYVNKAFLRLILSVLNSAT